MVRDEQHDFHQDQCENRRAIIHAGRNTPLRGRVIVKIATEHHNRVAVEHNSALVVARREARAAGRDLSPNAAVGRRRDPGVIVGEACSTARRAARRRPAKGAARHNCRVANHHLYRDVARMKTKILQIPTHHISYHLRVRVAHAERGCASGNQVLFADETSDGAATI